MAELFNCGALDTYHQHVTKHRSLFCVDNVKSKVKEGKLVGAVFIDLSKAFDTLSQSKLNLKLHTYGMGGLELLRFQDYLFNRSQRVQYKGILTDEYKITCGVAQGSIIGPLMFVLFYNDSPSCQKYSKTVIYADDTVIYIPGKDTFIIESQISANMRRIMEWSDDNEVILNLNKSEVMLFGTDKNLSKQPANINVTHGPQTVQFTTSYKYLGVEIDPTLNMNANFDSTYKKASSRLRLLNKLRPFLTVNPTKSFYQSMVLPTLTYCGSYITSKPKSMSTE